MYACVFCLYKLLFFKKKSVLLFDSCESLKIMILYIFLKRFQVYLYSCVMLRHGWHAYGTPMQAYGTRRVRGMQREVMGTALIVVQG